MMITITLPKVITYGDKYTPAMKIETQDDADAYFEACVQHSMLYGTSRKKAEAIERENLGYYAGYFSDEVQQRVNRLFRTRHPIFGMHPPTPIEALNIGIKRGRKSKREAKECHR